MLLICLMYIIGGGEVNYLEKEVLSRIFKMHKYQFVKKLFILLLNCWIWILVSMYIAGM